QPRGRKALATLALGTLATVTAAGLLWEASGPATGAGHPAAAPTAAPTTAAQVDALSALPTPSTPAATASPSASTAAPTTAPPTTAAPTPTAAPRAAEQPSTANYAQQVLDLVNVQRSQHGCGPLTANSKLQAAAQGQSDDMAARQFFDHTNPDGAGPQQRIEAAGYQWSSWGENIARGQADPGSVMDSWMNSQGHRANILNCDFKEMGVGIHLGPGGPWWTQDFGSPA
ncbi:CAP domain-containing protein, partial [Kitasatospora sp. LaBMicrA B282]|uniref:CAP domain-containing protein n=1 Tax=Kitasatospora sp. LaBMicrA B282 TaxID=3420949 RepID=UPI003D151A44